MISRRKFIVTALSATGAMAGLPSCSSEPGAESYETVAERTWRHSGLAAGDQSALAHELVRYATLAPSSHNTQCWKFRSKMAPSRYWLTFLAGVPAATRMIIIFSSLLVALRRT